MDDAVRPSETESEHGTTLDPAHPSADEDNFVDLLREEMAARRREPPSGSRPDAEYLEHVFSDWGAELLEENGYLAGFESAPWRFTPPGVSAEMKLNGFHFEESEGRAAIVVAEWDIDASATTKIPRRNLERLVSQGANFLERALLAEHPLHDRLEQSLPHADFAAQLWSNRDAIRTITLFVLVNGLTSEAAVDDRMVGDIRLKIDVWDARRLIRINEGRLKERSDLIIDFTRNYGGPLSCLPAPVSDPRYSAYLAILPGETLARVYDDFGPRLLEENVRAYLQLQGGVNRGIRKTLMDEPGSFFAYNNGLSATAEKIDLDKGSNGPVIKSLVGLQIVNGAQTTGSIHRAWKLKEAELDRVWIPVKITCVTTEAHADVTERISLYANSQNAVRLDDFSSNSAFHVRLEELSRRTWSPSGKCRWYYERTRGQYQDQIGRSSGAEATAFRRENPPSQKFTKADMAKFVLAWDGRPDFVSLGSQKNFIRFSADWLKPKGEDWRPDDIWYRNLVAKAIVYNSLRSLVKAEGLPGYSGNVVAYAVSLLADIAGERIKLGTIWTQQQISQQLSDSLRRWIRPIYEILVRTSNGKNVTEWAKKALCWEAVKAETFLPLESNIPEISTEGGSVRGRPARIPDLNEGLTADRETLLRLAREVTGGRVMKREDVIKELQLRTGVKRLTIERRTELESVLDDLTRLAFIDDPETTRTNDGLAIIRRLTRSGTQSKDDLVRNVAREWLEAKRVGPRIRDEIDAVLKVARRRLVVDFEGDDVFCPTKTFESYDGPFLCEMIQEIVSRKKRMYVRRMVNEATIQGLGFSHARVEMIERVDRCIETMIVGGRLFVPAEGALQRGDA
jgi:hypothetical protein